MLREGENTAFDNTEKANRSLLLPDLNAKCCPLEVKFIAKDLCTNINEDDSIEARSSFRLSISMPGKGHINHIAQL
jgi:hypothetical protein